MRNHMPGITLMSGQYICLLTCTLSAQKPHTRRLAMRSHLVTDLCSRHRVSFTFPVSCHTQHTKSTSSALFMRSRCASSISPLPTPSCPKNKSLHTIGPPTPFLSPITHSSTHVRRSTPSHTPFCHSPSPPTSPFTSLCPLPLLLAVPLLLA